MRYSILGFALIIASVFFVSGELPSLILNGCAVLAGIVGVVKNAKDAGSESGSELG